MKQTMAQRRWRVIINWQDNPTKSLRWIAKKSGESHKFVARWVKRFKETDGVDSVKARGRPRKFCARDLQRMKKIAMEKHCGSKTISALLKAKNGKAVSASTVNNLNIKSNRYCFFADFNLALADFAPLRV